jgi:hypothetical protein
MFHPCLRALAIATGESRTPRDQRDAHFALHHADGSGDEMMKPPYGRVDLPRVHEGEGVAKHMEHYSKEPVTLIEHIFPGDTNDHDTLVWWSLAFDHGQRQAA